MVIKFIAILCVMTGCFSAAAQTAREKAESIAAAFDKGKHKSKEKNGVHTKQDKVVTARPDIRSDISAYTGRYAIDGLGEYIVLRRNAAKQLEAVLTDRTESKLAVLKNIQIESGLLQAVLEHSNGKKQPFEAAFISRTENGETNFGIGITQLLSLSNGFMVDKAFYKRVD